MLIIPAVDIKGARCVRLTEGRPDAETVYGEDPLEAASRWARLGARLIHVVDLDGAFAGRPVSYEIIKRIARKAGAPIEVGGGIRDEAAAELYLSLEGVERIVLGTALVERPALLERLAARFPGKIAVGLDARDGFVAIRGWKEVTEKRAVDLARSIEGRGVAAIIYTDISRDGTLKGPNVEATAALAASVKIPVIASGGISSIDDMLAYRETGVAGVIIGKALYAGAVDLAEALRAADN